MFSFGPCLGQYGFHSASVAALCGSISPGLTPSLAFRSEAIIGSYGLMHLHAFSSFIWSEYICFASTISKTNVPSLVLSSRSTAQGLAATPFIFPCSPSLLNHSNTFDFASLFRISMKLSSALKNAARSGPTLGRFFNRIPSIDVILSNAARCPSVGILHLVSSVRSSIEFSLSAILAAASNIVTGCIPHTLKL